MGQNREEIAILTTNLFVILGVMLLLWLVSLWRHDASIVDPFWGTGFVLLAWLSFLQQEGPATARAMASAGDGHRVGNPPVALPAVAELGTRRGSTICRHAEAPRNFLLVGQSRNRLRLCRACCCGSSLVPFNGACSKRFQPRHSGLIDGLGLLGLADRLDASSPSAIGSWPASKPIQLIAVRSSIRACGAIRRHPNYFGDFCVWWGIYLVAAGGGAWWTIFSPLLMSVLLMRVSGVRLLESTISERRPAYREYVRRTNAFFPGPPRH